MGVKSLLAEDRLVGRWGRTDRDGGSGDVEHDRRRRQPLCYVLELLRDIVELVEHLEEDVCMPGNSCLQRSHVLGHGVDLAIDLHESSVDCLEPGIHLLEPLVHPFLEIVDTRAESVLSELNARCEIRLSLLQPLPTRELRQSLINVVKLVLDLLWRIERARDAQSSA